jgi:hypothetical protein
MKTFKFYGVCGNCYKLDETVWEAIEDPDDGYRSYLKSIEIAREDGNYTFSRVPLAIVEARVANDIDGWKLWDVVDGHLWLTVGTDNSDDYYPNFVFEYTPKKPQTAWENFIRE